MRRTIITSACLVSLIAAAPASAYELKETSKGATVMWMEHVLPIVVQQTGDADRDALLMDAVRGAAAEWAKSADVLIDIRAAKVGEAPPVAFDAQGTNTSVVRWAGGSWPYDTSTLALTFLRYDVATGQVYDADILINDENFAWADRMTGTMAEPRYDLQNTITHELGHALGLAHSHIDSATMFSATNPTDVAKRFLHEDDENGAATLYGNSGDRLQDDYVPMSPPTYGCTTTAIAGSDPMFLALLLLGAFGLVRRRFAKVQLPLALALALALPGMANASELGGVDHTSPTSLEQLVNKGDAVVWGRVIDQRVERRSDGIIVTITRLVLARCLAGLCPEEMEIEQLGGELDGLGMWVEGISVLDAAEEPVLVLKAKGQRWSVVGLDRGKLMDARRARPGELSDLQKRVFSAWKLIEKAAD